VLAAIGHLSDVHPTAAGLFDRRHNPLWELALIANDPDAVHRWQSLLSAEEHAFQLDGLAGARRVLPNRWVHELFEQRVEAHPDAVAGAHRGRELTYRELNARANRVGPPC
jgi:non-ribosomal peptide synthetase component F